MIFGRRGFFGYSVRDHGDVYWFANMAWDGGTTRERLEAVSPAEWKRQLLDLFADDAGPARDILRATTDELAASPLYDMPVVPTWHRDSMVIIGDAAHATSPSSGQGASMAIEDAIVLAKCLRDCEGIRQAFATYERLRRKRVERVVAYSARRTKQERGSRRSLVSGSADAGRAEALRQPERPCLAVPISHRLERARGLTEAGQECPEGIVSRVSKPFTESALTSRTTHQRISSIT